MTGENQQHAALETILQPGQVLGGKYRVDKLLGKGGMAAVWAGENQPTGKRVALKVILRSFVAANGGDASEMFRREALAAGRVNHPNVVNVFDVIDHEGMTCIVMELLDGEHFGAYLARKGFLSVEEAATMLLPAMRGVAAANAEGVVHRDLKPQNIFLCVGPDGRYVTTKVLDFGISVIMEKALEAGTSTRLVTTHGTPAYMSPEHITGAPNIDERADVYGFGILFYEALSGQLPYLGEPGPALLMRILNSPAPRITLFRPDLSEPIVEIIERAMDRDPARRFQSLDEFVRALEELVFPPSPLPRSLTPMAGVPIMALSEPKSGSITETVVRSVHRAESSGLHPITETRALYTLSTSGSRPSSPEQIVPPPESPQYSEDQSVAGAPVDDDDGVVAPIAEDVRHGTARVSADARTSTTEVSLHQVGSGRLGKRLATAFLLLAGVALAVWVVMPMGPSRRSRVESLPSPDFPAAIPSPESAVQPAPPPSPSPPLPSPSAGLPTPPLPPLGLPGALDDQPAANVPDSPLPSHEAAPALPPEPAVGDLGAFAEPTSIPIVRHKKIERVAPSRTKAARAPTHASRPAVREMMPKTSAIEPPPANASSASASASATATATQTATRTRTSSVITPRAGSLSPDDF
jgi:serine/threonine protein kinase